MQSRRKRAGSPIRNDKINQNLRKHQKENMTLTTQSTLIPRDDCSYITLQCLPHDYSASILTHACEDAGAPVVDLLTSPADSTSIRVTLRVRCEDPTPAVHNLERYGYEVSSVEGNSYTGGQLSAERLLELQTLLNI